MWWWRRCRWRCWRRLGLRPGGRRRCCGAKLGMDSVARILVIVYTWRGERIRFDFSGAGDNDILDWFRRQVDEAGGGNYQTLINEALHGFILQKQEPLEIGRASCRERV